MMSPFSPRKVLLFAFEKLQLHVLLSFTKVRAERPRDCWRSLNKRGKNFHAKSPNEINTSRMPDGLGRLVQDMRSFSLVPARGCQPSTHPITSRCLGYGRKPHSRTYHVTMILTQKSSGLVQEVREAESDKLFAAHFSLNAWQTRPDEIWSIQCYTGSSMPSTFYNKLLPYECPSIQILAMRLRDLSPDRLPRCPPYAPQICGEAVFFWPR
jgi:hypothetical protein